MEYSHLISFDLSLVFPLNHIESTANWPFWGMPYTLCFDILIVSHCHVSYPMNTHLAGLIDLPKLVSSRSMQFLSQAPAKLPGLRTAVSCSQGMTRFWEQNICHTPRSFPKDINSNFARASNTQCRSIRASPKTGGALRRPF